MELQLEDQRWHVQVTLSVALTQAPLGDLACHDASHLITPRLHLPGGRKKKDGGSFASVVCNTSSHGHLPCFTLPPSHIISLW